MHNPSDHGLTATPSASHLVGFGRGGVSMLCGNTTSQSNSTGTVVWSIVSTDSSPTHVDRPIELSVDCLSRVWQNGLSDGCRAQLRLRGMPTVHATSPPPLAHVFRVTEGKYCSRSSGGSDPQ